MAIFLAKILVSLYLGEKRELFNSPLTITHIDKEILALIRRDQRSKGPFYRFFTNEISSVEG